MYDIAGGRVSRLTSMPGTEAEATFSPDGRRVAFVRSNNLHVVDVASQQERALTSDGGPQLLNGKLDWLYQEDILDNRSAGGRGAEAQWPVYGRLGELELQD